MRYSLPIADYKLKPIQPIACPIYCVEGDNDYRLPKVIVQNRLPFTYA
jgi:surfactin synthase thioesterase subunit